jgi:hypothetical protein
MSFGIDSRKLKKLIDLYHPNNQAEEMKYLLLLKGEDDLYISTSHFTQISKPVPSRGYPSTPLKTESLSTGQTNSKTSPLLY